METEVQVGIIAGATAVLTALIHALVGLYRTSNESKQIALLEKDLKQSKRKLSFDQFITQSDHAFCRIDSLADNSTEIDRVLVFKAVNGKYDPVETTCFHAKRTGQQADYRYDHYPIQSDYVETLRGSYNVPSIRVTPSLLQNAGQVFNVYAMEGVTDSIWVHLGTKEKEGGRAEIFYVTFATHNPDGISESTRTECEVAASELRRFVQLF